MSHFVFLYCGDFLKDTGCWTVLCNWFNQYWRNHLSHPFWLKQFVTECPCNIQL